MSEEKKNRHAPHSAEHNATLHKRFLDRLVIHPHLPKFTIRKWMAILGIVLFIALVIAFYATKGG